MSYETWYRLIKINTALCILCFFIGSAFPWFLVGMGFFACFNIYLTTGKYLRKGWAKI